MSLLADLRIWLVVLVVSALGTVAALAPYYLGKRGIEAVLSRFPQLSRERLEHVQSLYREHGSGLLFFSFIPMLGLLLSTGAGIGGVQISTFVVWVLVGRTLRNSLILVLVDQGVRMFLVR